MKRTSYLLSLAALAAVAALTLLGVPDLHQLGHAAGVALGVLSDPHAAFILATGPLVIERKSEGGGAPTTLDEVKKLVGDLVERQQKAWHDFKSINDDRLKEIEKKGSAGSDALAKVDACNAELNKLSAEIADIIKKMQRPGIGAGEGKGLTPEQAEYKAGLRSYLRDGKETGLRDLEAKAITRGTDPDGGFFVGAEMDAAIDRVATAEMSMLRLATVRDIGKASYKKMVKTRGMSGVWLGEQDEPGEGQGPRYEEVEIEAHRIGVEPWVTNDMLEDVDYDLEGDLTDEAAQGFAEAEGDAYINGDGIKRPRGLLAYPMVANANWAWGKVGFIATGAAGAFPANPGDKLIDLQHALKQRYRNGASWLMADGTLASVRQMKDGSGAYYLWQPDPLAGFGGRLLGSPVEVDDYMPAIAPNAFAVGYGNYKRAYTIVRRRGIYVIRDNVTRKGMTKFHFSRRTGGGITHFEAVKFLKFA